MKKFENQDLQWLFNDCERIAKEIKENQLKIKFFKIDNINGTKKHQLTMYDKKGRIIVTKDYASGPDNLEFTYKNGTFK